MIGGHYDLNDLNLKDDLRPCAPHIEKKRGDEDENFEKEDVPAEGIQDREEKVAAWMLVAEGRWRKGNITVTYIKLSQRNKRLSK